MGERKSRQRNRKNSDRKVKNRVSPRGEKKKKKKKRVLPATDNLGGGKTIVGSKHLYGTSGLTPPGRSGSGDR